MKSDLSDKAAKMMKIKYPRMEDSVLNKEMLKLSFLKQFKRMRIKNIATSKYSSYVKFFEDISDHLQ